MSSTFPVHNYIPKSYNQLLLYKIGHVRTFPMQIVLLFSFQQIKYYLKDHVFLVLNLVMKSAGVAIPDYVFSLSMIPESPIAVLADTAACNFTRPNSLGFYSFLIKSKLRRFRGERRNNCVQAIRPKSVCNDRNGIRGEFKASYGSYPIYSFSLQIPSKRISTETGCGNEERSKFCKIVLSISISALFIKFQ